MTKLRLTTSGAHDDTAGLRNESTPLTIPQWKAAQVTAGGLERLLSIVENERETNSATHTWISLATSEQIKFQWTNLEARGSEATSLPLYGVPFAVKDNIDAEGFVTTAACPKFRSEPAISDATVVAKLKAAGAILIGKTNLDQFATGLVGTRSPYGAVPNTFDPTRVSGGSSSGSAVVVARGIVPFALGTDTAGSGRVPAGLNNIVGLKPTRGAISTHGVLPACRTLDCIAIFSLTVADAETILSIAEGYDIDDSYSRSRPNLLTATVNEFGGHVDMSKPKLALCASPNWYGRDDHYSAYEKALVKVEALGWSLVPVDFDILFQLARLLYDGPWIAERYEAIRDFIEGSFPEDMDPVVRNIIVRAKSLSAADVFGGEYLRQELTRKVEHAFAAFDGLLVPTSPTFPTLDEVRSRPVEENSILGTYTNFVNFLDWSALSIPAGFRSDGLPFGMTLISNHWKESCLFSWARVWFGNEQRPLGATGVEACEPCSMVPSDLSDQIPLVILDSHISGFPLNASIVSCGGRFWKRMTTASSYRLCALDARQGVKGPVRLSAASSSDTPGPVLKRVSPDDGAEIEVEVWHLPKSSLANFISNARHPFAFGSIEMSDGTWIQGFVCEPCGFDNAIDITDYYSRRAYYGLFETKTEQSSNGIRKRSISTVLVANRGEIAVRIIETVHKMGLRAVTIYSEADADATHVSMADLSLKLHGSSVSETYLDIEQILELAAQSSVDAVIPGYGFLSENAEFAAAVEDRGMIWVGPTPQQMTDLGLKHRARSIATKAGVPIIPGCRSLLTSLEEALSEGNRIGFPLMLKSTAGGGGIGLSYCKDVESLSATFEGVQRQAVANFGNGGVFLERYIKRARHIEVQILGDGAGRVITAGERDCSLQRRHQKIVEESPASMIPKSVRLEMREAASRLASSVRYRNVGTVEFIYDLDSKKFYFLEVNTRLQVEHPVTELVTGLDLVECMLNIADGNATQLFETSPQIKDASIEVRVYAESPLQNFRPCSGCITALEFPASLRVDTWVKVGTEITASFDPLIAKLISFGHNREEAIENMVSGLATTRVEGVQTNLEYLHQIVSSSMFRSGEFTTKSLDTFHFLSSSFEVLEPGAFSAVQDYPGRTGYWSIGVPPSGPMDSFSFRMGNRVLNNPPGAAGLECTLMGPTLKFHCDAVIAVSGGVAPVTIDGLPAAQNKAIIIHAGQTLSIGVVERGHRVYLSIQGGIKVPVVMGSRSTFELGKLGGFGGRRLQQRDILQIGSSSGISAIESHNSAFSVPIPTYLKASWVIRVIPGPHGAPDYFTRESAKALYLSQWKVHHNSNRLGIRLTGPQPEWSRKTGGKAGLHPSNIHDAPYSIGSVSFTGDEAVILGCDGPSLGGFVVLCVVCSADLWKMGQVRPGDTIRFIPIEVEAAIELGKQLNQAIETLSPLPVSEVELPNQAEVAQILETIPSVVGVIEHDGEVVNVRQAGDHAFLLEFGDGSTFDLRHNFAISAFCENHHKTPIAGVGELTPGIFSLHVTYEQGISPPTILERLREHIRSYKVPSKISSRRVRMPIAFDDSVSRAAIERYTATIRGDAPWLPSNIDFLEKLNGIEHLTKVLTDAEFVVLGLGDVFMGSPCAIPLHQRHRLFGTKYNPSRSFTPRGAVGIGGQYMCIYAADSPGGYQLVGRTVEIWDSDLVDVKGSSAWFFRRFDRISFYPVSEHILDHTPRSELVQITGGVLDLVEYESWLEENKESISATVSRQEKAISNAPFLEELLLPYQVDSVPSNQDRIADSSSVSGERVKATMPGRCYKVMVKEGQTVEEGDIILCVESSKMEMEICSHVSGRCLAVLVKAGDLIDIGEDLIIIEE
ncbi:putative dur1,2-urea amidolyase [Fusarium longipes]|uniref:Putative dur1,2-urea amidolyase n=1 Tax=Fusarium longipes TaxID=694270 RepID=A0A395S0K5_9HYPO|nr:putative dur1,2-urea amidolyase [Fusarium longipes]